MTIDFHTHIFPDKIASKTIEILAKNSNSKPYTDGTAADLVSKMEEADVDICVALPVLTKATQFDSVFNFVCDINKRFEHSKNRIISFCGMHPDCEDVENKIKLIKNAGMLGIKIHPDYQQTYINDKRYIKIIDCAKDYDLIVVTHSGIDYGYVGKPVMCPPNLVLDMLKQVNYNKIVLAHYGGNGMYD